MKEFLWGTATSSHQVEGGNTNNDWWEWEKNGNIKTGDSSLVSCYHYNLYKEDFKLIKFLENNSYRFSIEWSRIEPKRGVFNDREIEHYIDVLKELKKQNIEPILTIHHFTIPVWFRELGGFESEESPKIFSCFVEKIVPYFKDYVKFWITINEPMVLSSLGYILGIWPPGEKSTTKAFKVTKNLILSHMEASRIIRENDKNAFISVAQNILIFKPNFIWNPFDYLLAKILDYNVNFSFLDALITGKIPKPISKGESYSDLRNSINYIGLNYYTKVFVKFALKGFLKEGNKNLPRSDFNLYIYPEGIERVLLRLHERYGMKILITENGIADAKDKWRGDFILQTVEAMKNANRNGVDIIGYIHWSLLDNFEWNEGYAMKFGLFEVDFTTQERKPRKSAFIYKEVARKYKFGLQDEN